MPLLKPRKVRWIGSHANRGKDWETTLTAWHEIYLDQGIGRIFRTNPPVTITRSNVGKGMFQGFYSKEGPPDFVGSITCEGLHVPVIFDAKNHNSNEARWHLGNIKDHQAQDLTNFPGIAFIALLWGNDAFVLPWPALRILWDRWRAGRAERGQASLTFDDVQRLGRSMTDFGWIDPVREIASQSMNPVNQT